VQKGALGRQGATRYYLCKSQQARPPQAISAAGATTLLPSRSSLFQRAAGVVIVQVPWLAYRPKHSGRVLEHATLSIRRRPDPAFLVLTMDIFRALRAPHGALQRTPRRQPPPEHVLVMGKSCIFTIRNHMWPASHAPARRIVAHKLEFHLPS